MGRGSPDVRLRRGHLGPRPRRRCGASRSRRISGGYCAGETPLPIPNRAVKPRSADGTWDSRSWESRSPPVLLVTSRPTGRLVVVAGLRRRAKGAAVRRRAGRAPWAARPRSAPRRASRPEAARVQWLCPAPAGVPVLPDRAPAAGGSGPPRRPMGCRRDADLGARADRPWPARARLMTEMPAVRVLADGGVGLLVPVRRTGRRGEGGLTQGRELDGRVDGVPHPLAERALGRAACGHRGEHVFVKLRAQPDGRGLAPSSAPDGAVPFGSGTSFGRRADANGLAAAPAAAGGRPCGGGTVRP